MALSLTWLRSLAQAYPEAYEESPWGDLCAKVNGKIFLFYGEREGRLSVSLKLPHSAEDALVLEGVAPTGYGLGNHGWISANLSAGGVPEETVRAWIEESYRAVAPKRLGATLPEGGPEPQAPKPMPTVPANAPSVWIVAEDALRAERLVRALGEAGVQGIVSRATTAELADVDAAAIVVDVGRSAALALEVAGELALIHFDIPLVLAGLKDAKTLKRVAAIAGNALLFRQAPGDPAVVDGILALLRA